MDRSIIVRCINCGNRTYLNHPGKKTKPSDQIPYTNHTTPYGKVCSLKCQRQVFRRRDKNMASDEYKELYAQYNHIGFQLTNAKMRDVVRYQEHISRNDEDDLG
jgi:hypothetical protein